MTTFNKQCNELVKATLSKRQWINDQRDNDKNIQVVDKLAESQDFFQDNNALGKRYTTTRIKPRNFCLILLTSELTRKITTTKNFILISSC